MGKKIFVSYKYADDNVQALDNKRWWETTTVRDYVDILETISVRRKNLQYCLTN